MLPTMTHTLMLDPQSGSTQEAFHTSLAPDWAEQLDQVMQRDRNFFPQHPAAHYLVPPITPRNSQGPLTRSAARGKNLCPRWRGRP